MLRINLLPAYVLLRRRNRQVAILFSGLFAALTAVTLVWYFSLAPIPGRLAQEVAEGQAMQTKIQGVNDQATAAIAALGQINTNLTAYQAIQTYNTAYVQLYQRVVGYTSPRILYNGMSTTGTTLNISGYTHSLGDLGRYLQAMYTEPDASAITLTSGIPGSTSPNPDTPQTYSIPAGVRAHLPGYSRPVSSYTVQKGIITSVNSGGAGAGAGAQASAFGRPGGVAGTAANPGQFGASAGQSGSANTFDVRHDGFPFTVALTLKAPLTPPSPSGGTGTGTGAAGGPGRPGGAGGFGAPGGRPGGYGGFRGGLPGTPNAGPGGNSG